MWSTLATILMPIIKFIFERIAKQKLNDKQFIEYVTAHQKLRANAGQTALDWEEALKQAQAEMENKSES